MSLIWIQIGKEREIQGRELERGTSSQFSRINLSNIFRMGNTPIPSSSLSLSLLSPLLSLEEYYSNIVLMLITNCLLSSRR